MKRHPEDDCSSGGMQPGPSARVIATELRERATSRM